jgi:hypothetical protein
METNLLVDVFVITVVVEEEITDPVIMTEENEDKTDFHYFNSYLEIKIKGGQNMFPFFAISPPRSVIFPF